MFSILKEVYNGKYVELDFSQNVALQPKDEVQSGHFSGTQFTLYCAIIERAKFRYHYHICDDTCGYRATMPHLSIRINMHLRFARE